MKKGFFLCAVILSITTMTGCSVSNPTVTDTAVANTQTQSSVQPGATNILGLPASLNLSSDQINQIQELRKQITSQIDPVKANEVMKIMSNAFTSDAFDLDSLKTKLSGIDLPVENYYSSEANVIISSYNVLTNEQKQTLLSSEQSIVSSPLDAGMLINLALSGFIFDRVVTELSLDSTQQKDIKAILQPIASDNSNSLNNKVTQDAINNELKTGNPSAEKIADILKYSSVSSEQLADLNKLTGIYDILSSEQRQKFINMVSSSLSMFTN